METRASYVVVGSFVLVLLAALFVAVVWIAKIQLEGAGALYRVYFTGSTTGLQEGSPVRFRGVPVGTVTDIRIDPENVERVQVTIEVLEETPIKADAVASLEIQGITGGAYVQIEGGSQEAPLLTAVTERDVPVIPSRPSTIEAVVDAAPLLLENLVQLSERVADILDAENEQAITRILANVQQLTATLADATGDVERTLDGFDEAVVNANALITDLRAATATLTAGAERTLAEARGTLGTIDEGAEAVAGELVATTDDVQALAASLQRTSEQLAALVGEIRGPTRDFAQTGLYEFTLLLAELRELTTNLTRVTTQIERSPAEFLFRGQGREVEVR